MPAGVEVVFTSTATDVLHGFNIEGTRLNMMLIPGASELAAREGFIELAAYLATG